MAKLVAATPPTDGAEGYELLRISLKDHVEKLSGADKLAVPLNDEELKLLDCFGMITADPLLAVTDLESLKSENEQILTRRAVCQEIFVALNGAVVDLKSAKKTREARESRKQQQVKTKEQSDANKKLVAAAKEKVRKESAKPGKSQAALPSSRNTAGAFIIVVDLSKFGVAPSYEDVAAARAATENGATPFLIKTIDATKVCEDGSFKVALSLFSGQFPATNQCKTKGRVQQPMRPQHLRSDAKKILLDQVPFDFITFDANVPPLLEPFTTISTFGYRPGMQYHGAEYHFAPTLRFLITGTRRVWLVNSDDLLAGLIALGRDANMTFENLKDLCTTLRITIGLVLGLILRLGLGQYLSIGSGLRGYVHMCLRIYIFTYNVRASYDVSAMSHMAYAVRRTYVGRACVRAT